MKVSVLGSGTSQGVPVLGCACPVCVSQDPRDQRLRSSILISSSTTQLLVDAGPDVRQQLLRKKVDHLDAVFLTHEHNDHIIGMDDLRPFFFALGRPFPVYAKAQVLASIVDRFPYAFQENPYPGAPQFEMITLGESDKWILRDIAIQLIPVMHGTMPVSGLRINDFAYVTDVNFIPESSLSLLQGLDILILDCLRIEPHHSHMHLEGALELIAKLRPKRTYLTHISHLFGKHTAIEQLLPEGVLPAWDGLVLDI